MKVLCHHIYEYKKGLRNLVLHTMNSSDLKQAEEKLEKLQITYFVQHVTPNKVNIFFGKEECVRIIHSFGKDSLNSFSDEEDFILGIMLGYDRMLQCNRYIKRKSSFLKVKYINPKNKILNAV
jgi:hypothetical protein